MENLQSIIIILLPSLFFRSDLLISGEHAQQVCKLNPDIIGGQFLCCTMHGFVIIFKR